MASKGSGQDVDEHSLCICVGQPNGRGAGPGGRKPSGFRLTGWCWHARKLAKVERRGWGINNKVKKHETKQLVENRALLPVGNPL